MKFLLVAVFISGIVFAFGVSGVPDVPEANIPDIDIPGMELLDEIQVKLDGLLSIADTLGTLIPDLTVLEDLSLKLEELRDTDPEIAELQAKVDELREELVFARSQIETISSDLETELATIQMTVDDFTEGLPVH